MVFILLASSVDPLFPNANLVLNVSIILIEVLVNTPVPVSGLQKNEVLSLTDNVKKTYTNIIQSPAAGRDYPTNRFT